MNDDNVKRLAKRPRTATTTTTSKSATVDSNDEGSIPVVETVGQVDNEEETTITTTATAAMFENLVDDEADEFISPEEREARAARERRHQRQERLKRLATTETAMNNSMDQLTAVVMMPPTSGTMGLSNRNDDDDDESHQRYGQRVDLQDYEPSPVIRTTTTTATAANSASSTTQQPMKVETRDHDDMFDLFSSSLSPDPIPTTTDNAAIAPPNNNNNNNNKNQNNNTTRGQEQQDWDDAEGYYKAVIGETIPLSAQQQYELRVSGVIGKGVFSTVLKCTTIKIITNINNQNNDDYASYSLARSEPGEMVALPPTVAVKLIRHNETMAKAALREIEFLLKFKENTTVASTNNNPPPSDETAAMTTTGIVPLLLPLHVTQPLDYRGHTMLVFPYVPYNLRDVLQKFGKGVGLSLQSVQSYFGQLLSALYHLQKRNLIHADIKPDNILVSENYSTVLLCDFGSAIEMHSTDHLPTPYLVSRFYRAPEVILGLLPTPAIDVWSVAVSVAEIFLGNVVLAGTTNNDMLYLMMQQLGPFSHRLVRQHLLACQRLGLTGNAVHFAAEDSVVYHFLQQTTDAVTGQPVVRHVPLQDSAQHTNNNNNSSSKTSNNLKARLLKAKSAKDSRTKVLQFAELLQKCLALDPTRRISVKEAMHHSFLTSA